MKYIDTSVLVSALIPEATSVAALSWLVNLTDNDVAISPWVNVEFGGALARKLRMGRITPAERQNALDEFEEAWIAVVTTIPMESRHFELARQICDAHEAGIRPADAVHLAVASLSNRTLVTFDKPFSAGATALGYSVKLIA